MLCPKYPGKVPEDHAESIAMRLQEALAARRIAQTAVRTPAHDTQPDISSFLNTPSATLVALSQTRTPNPSQSGALNAPQAATPSNTAFFAPWGTGFNQSTPHVSSTPPSYLTCPQPHLEPIQFAPRLNLAHPNPENLQARSSSALGLYPRPWHPRN